MNYRKQKLAFLRKLYLAFLIDRGEHNVPSLERWTGMPRRTIQDSLNALDDIGIVIEFKRAEGKRHNDGTYQLLTWGPIEASWIEQEAKHICAALGIKQQPAEPPEKTFEKAPEKTSELKIPAGFTAETASPMVELQFA